MGFPCGSAGKESACSAGDLGLIPGLGSPGEGRGYTLRYSGLQNSVDHIVHGVTHTHTHTKSWTRPSNFHIHICIYAFFFIFFSITACHRVLNIVPCAEQ